MLAHFDPSLPLCLAADASAYGIGAVISHIFSNGEERPIAYALRTLSSGEKNYAQLESVEWEALSLIYGVQKFHQHLYGRSFVLYTDHKPLTSILNPKKGIPPLSVARLQRWALILSAYNYKIVYNSTQAHSNADGLSRLPMVVNKEQKQLPEPSVFNVRQIENLPVTAMQLKTVTRRDPVLSKVTVTDDLKLYWMKRTEIRYRSKATSHSLLVARSHSTRVFKLATRKSLYTWFTTKTFMKQSYLTYNYML